VLQSGIMAVGKTTKEVAANIGKLRAAKRLTQSEVAEKGDINSNYFAQIERGEINLSVEMLEKVCKGLGAKSSEILPF
jgi:transcriptional regulator with XRE-family HTH domain